jgi:hypothetical protein
VTAADSGTDPDLLLPIVEAITRVDPTVDRALVQATVAAVVGGHAAKRWRLARAISERPQVLADDSVRIRLGDRPIEMPEPLAALTRELVTARTRSHTYREGQTWLFPGRLAGRPITDTALRDRLARIGIHAKDARNAALFQLATELPAAILARVLGLDIKCAVRWQRACAGDWTKYAADVSRRR